MKLKRFVQKIFIFILIFAFVFGDFANTGIFSKGTVQVQAADKISKYTKTGHKTIFNPYIGTAGCKTIARTSGRIKIRNYEVKDVDDGTKRVICGYAYGHTHTNDYYKKRVVLASNWKDNSNKSPYMHNVKRLAQGLAWFYDDVGAGKASAMQSIFIQTFVWSESMGLNTENALKQMASSKGWNWNKTIKPIYEKIKKRTVEGYIVIYEFDRCTHGGHQIHQPYFRWTSTKPEKDSVSAKDNYELSKNVNVSVGKADSATGEAVVGAKFKVSTTGVSGSPWVLTTDKKGNASMSITRKFSGSGSGKCNYVKNWDKLTKKQKKKMLTC